MKSFRISQVSRQWLQVRRYTPLSFENFTSHHLASLAERSSSAAQAASAFAQLTASNRLTKAHCNSLLASLAVHPDPFLRQDILRYMRERWIQLDATGWHYIAAGYVKEMQIEKALETLDDMGRADISAEPWLLDMLTYTLCDMGELNEAFTLLKHRIHAGAEDSVTPTLWHYIFDCACTQLHHEIISLIWKRRVQMKYLNPNTGQCTATLHAAARHADVDLATSVVDLLSKRATPLESLHYELLIEAYLGVDDTDTALTVLCIMNEAGTLPTARSTKSLQLALQETFSPPPSDSHTTSSPNENPRVPALSRSKSAFATLVHLRDNGRTIPLSTLNAVLTATLNTHGLAAGITQYKQFSYLCGKDPTTATFNMLLLACAKAAAAPRGSPEHLDNQPEAALPEAQLNPLAAGPQAKAMTAKEAAVWIVSEMIAISREPDALTYDRLLQVFLRARRDGKDGVAWELSAREAREDFDTAMAYYGEMRQRGLWPKAMTLSSLAARAARLGEASAWAFVEVARKLEYDWEGMRQTVSQLWAESGKGGE